MDALAVHARSMDGVRRVFVPNPDRRVGRVSPGAALALVAGIVSGDRAERNTWSAVTTAHTERRGSLPPGPVVASGSAYCRMLVRYI